MDLQLPRQADFSASIFRRGQKKELFDELQEDAASLESELKSKLENLASLWAAERVGKELSAAIWRPDLDMAEVVLQRGKAVAHLGCQQRSKLYLHIEEAVYLIDRANLLLFVEDAQRERRLLSLQEATELMVASGFGLDVYLVFCKLVRAGYIVQRHPARWMAGPREDLRSIWEHWRPHASPEPCQPAGGPQAQESDAPARQPSGPAEPRVAAYPAVSQPKAKRKRQEASRDWWPLQGVWCRNEADFWAGLPRATITVPQDDRAAARTRYPHLHPLPPGTAGDWQDWEAPAPQLHLDVWDPDVKFSRRGAGPPKMHVSVCLPGRAPSVHSMAAAEAAAGDVHVKFATVEKGDIGFYSFAHVSLQDIL